MANYGGQNFTSFSGVNIKGSIMLRTEGVDVAGTLKADLSEGLGRAWTFPNKSGTFPIMGTFSVDLPVIVTGDFSRTAVTVSGIRVEDGIVVTIQGDPLKNAGAIQNPAQLIACAAGNGSITLTFDSLGGTTTAYQTIPCAYVAVR